MRPYKFIVTDPASGHVEKMEMEGRTPEHAADRLLDLMTEIDGWQGLEVTHAAKVDA